MEILREAVEVELFLTIAVASDVFNHNLGT